MTREIKFREWETERKTMVIGEREDYDDSVSFRFEHEEGGERILMQYTGLKDKNGVEIFEGDIVYWESTIMNKNQWQGVVKFIGAGFCVQTSGNSRNTPDWLYAATKDETLEIIGNIYENPELLEKE